VSGAPSGKQPARVRVDQLLVERGLAPSRERAQSLLLSGQVLVGDRVVDKPGTKVESAAEIRLRGVDHPYVGRGGLKLAGALDDLGIDVGGAHCLDLGASTGGFTDCLLQRGAASVLAVDVGTNQLDWKLRSDPRVRSLEQTDARSLTRQMLGPAPQLAVVDVSFISLRLVLPSLAALLDSGAEALLLVKPQFEVGRGNVGKGGAVKDDVLRDAAVDSVSETARSSGFDVLARADSHVPGARAGNREVFLWLRRRGR
jgi:23S rRNA (cytidine1920-2'-O)/16S rRNA (cytidine1409-2'-O)-methyltransferase